MKNRLFAVILLSVWIVGLGDSALAQKRKKPKEEPYGLPRVATLTSNTKCTPNNQTAFLKISETGDFILGENKTERESLVDKLKSYLCGKLPDEQIVYLRASGNTPFRYFADVMKLNRKLEVDDYGLALDSETAKETPSGYYELKIPFEAPTAPEIKLHPLFMLVSIGADGQLALNKKEVNHAQLTIELKKVFSARLKRRVYRQGSREVEKTVFIEPTLSTKFEDVIKAVEAVKSADSQPIVLRIDNLREK